MHAMQKQHNYISSIILSNLHYTPYQLFKLPWRYLYWHPPLLWSWIAHLPTGWPALGTYLTTSEPAAIHCEGPEHNGEVIWKSEIDQID